MKKVILCTVVSLFVLSGFVAGPLGPGLAGAKAKVAAACSDLPNVETCILIKKNGKVEVVAGDGKKLRKPKKKDKTEEAPDSPGSPDTKNSDKLPAEIKDTEEKAKYGATYQEHHITIFGGNTCMRFNGTYYCW